MTETNKTKFYNDLETKFLDFIRNFSIDNNISEDDAKKKQ